MTHTLYLVDPDPTERRRLQSVLAAEADVVAAFESIETFLAQASEMEGECLVVSAALPEPELLALIESLQRRPAALPVIVLDRDTELRTAVNLMRAGAADFIEPGFGDRQLLAVVHQLFPRQTDFNPNSFIPSKSTRT
jgi:FixJ family two-component response regulator